MGILFSALIVFCLSYFFYAVFRFMFLRDARETASIEPWDAFKPAWWSVWVWGIAFSFNLVIFSTLLSLAFDVAGFLILLTCILFGVVFLILDVYHRYFAGQSPKDYWQLHPPPKLQFVMTDCYAGIFVYGATMAIFAAPAKQTALDSKEVFVLASFFLLFEGFGFFVALDILRRSKLLKRPLRRALLIGSLMAHTGFFFPLTWMA